MQAPPRKGNRWDSERGKHDWKGVAAKVAANPGEWVLADSHVASGTAQNVRNGKVIPLRDLGGKIEATIRRSRLVGSSRYGDLYVRWTPQEELDKEDASG